MGDAADERYLREQSFHDERFHHDEAREQAGRFYAVAAASRAHYRDRVRSVLRPGADVLEYGCGPGSEAPELARAGAAVVGIDISPVAIERARADAAAKGVSPTFRVMNAEHLEFDDTSFDLVCGSSILHHLDVERAIDEVARVLRPAGGALFLEPLGHNPLINLYRRLTPSMRSADEHPLHVRDLEVIRRRFDRVEVRWFHLFGLLAFPFRRVPGFQTLVRALDGVDRLVFRLVPPVRRWAWITTIEARMPRPTSR